MKNRVFSLGFKSVTLQIFLHSQACLLDGGKQNTSRLDEKAGEAEIHLLAVAGQRTYIQGGCSSVKEKIAWEDRK